MHKLVALLLLLSCLNSNGQKPEKVLVSQSDTSGLYKTSEPDSNTLFYLKMVPGGKPAGVLVILPGSGEMVEDVLKQINLHNLAVRNNLLVIFPSINHGTVKQVAEHRFLDTIFKQVIRQYELPLNKFIIGGFSAGGMLALTYTETAHQYKDSTVIIPLAVFGVDPPLDYAHLWNHCKKDIGRNFSDPAIQEAKSIMQSYRQELGGSPEEFPGNYAKYSIFSYSMNDGGNARYLIHTPVLLFTEPDILWQMKNRHRDFYDLNCADISAMINLLQTEGNRDAELVVTNNKGRRLNGMRHPHSWSIMDSSCCMAWILKQLAR